MHLDSSSRILVVAAHPDDEVLGCGGTLARARNLGAEIAVHFLGEGVSARFPVGKHESPEFRKQTEVRRQGAEKALAALGIKDVHFGQRLCCQFDMLPLLSIVQEIEAAISRFKPSILLTHDSCEVNVDHRTTFNAVEVACRPTRPETPKEIYSFEIVCSGNWKFDESFKPDVYVDISKSWKKKLEAWHCYEGESRPFPFPRSDQGLEVLARYRGMSAGLQMAEAFRLLRKIV